MVALDTNILIWGGLRQSSGKKSDSTSHAKEMEYRSRALMRDLEDRGETIVIPSVVVAELLVPLDETSHGSFLSILTTRFFCPSLDLRAASLAAKIWRAHAELPPDERLQRSLLKSDALIVAIPKVVGCSTFYSHDKKCRKLAEIAGMAGRDIPTHSEDMFTDVEIKKQVGIPPQSKPESSSRSRKHPK